MEKEIAPRIQVFVNKEILPELPLVEALIHELRLPKRCGAFGETFTAFVHTGSCDGVNEKHYGIWATGEELDKIPPFLAQSTLQHFGKPNLQAVFGETESVLYARMAEDESTHNYIEDAPVFYVDPNFDVYPNITAPDPFWCLGNLIADGAETILWRYLDNASPAQYTALTVPARELVQAYGDPNSGRLFGRGDYRNLLLNRWCRERQ